MDDPKMLWELRLALRQLLEGAAGVQLVDMA